jgi:hypothetical protein
MRLPIAIQNAVDRLLNELRHISDAIQQLTDSTAERCEGHNVQKSPTPEIRATLNAPQGIETRKGPAETKEERQYQNRTLVVQWSLCMVTTLAFVAAAYYAHIAKLQWQTMEKTYAEIQRQTGSVGDAAKAAARSATAAENSVKYAKDADRPWLGTIGGKSGDLKLEPFIDQRGQPLVQVIYAWHIRNAGKRPAYIRDIETTGRTYKTCTDRPDYSFLPPGARQAFGDEHNTSHSLVIPAAEFGSLFVGSVTKNEWQQMTNRALSLCLYYSIEYEDVAAGSDENIIHHTRDCMVVLPENEKGEWDVLGCNNNYSHAD